MPPRRPNPKAEQRLVDQWNATWKVGTPVHCRRDSGSIQNGVTTSEAYVMGGHSAVIHMTNVSGCYHLSRVTPGTLDSMAGVIHPPAAEHRVGA
jgi:hypothetical protein